MRLRDFLVSAAIGTIIGLVVTIYVFQTPKAWLGPPLDHPDLVLFAPGSLVAYLGFDSATTYQISFKVVQAIYYTAIVHGLRLLVRRLRRGKGNS